MKKKIIWLVLSCLMVAALVLASCAPAAVEEKEPQEVVGEVEEGEAPAVVPEEEEEEEAEEVAPAMETLTLTKLDGTKVTVEVEPAKYGGWITVSHGSDALTETFDPVIGSEQGWTSALTFERAAIADFTRGPRGTNEESFTSGYYTDEFKAGNLVDSWEVIDAKTIKFHVREGVRFQNLPPVNGRELVAEDFAYSHQRCVEEPRNQHYIPPGEDPSYIEVVDKYNFILHWPYNYAAMFHSYTLYHPVMAKEVWDEYGTFNDPEHQIGTGAFMVDDVVSAASVTFVRNPNYWKYDPFHPQNKLPYADGVKLLIVPDFGTQKAAFRTGKTDLLRYLTLDDAEELMETAPWANYREVQPGSVFCLWMNTMKEPFSDVRVRQAVAMGIDQPKYSEQYLKGKGNITAWPLMPTAGSAYVPYDELPPDVKKFYEYRPDEARALLTEAGYPAGFDAELVIWAGNDIFEDWASMIAEDLATIGIDVTIDATENFVDTLYNIAYDEFILTYWSNYMPEDVFGWAHDGLDSIYAFSAPSDPLAREAWTTYNDIGDPAERLDFLREEMFRQTKLQWEVPMPEAGQFWFWQPWFKNFGGECGLGPESAWGDHGIFQFIWIDQELKTEMGF